MVFIPVTAALALSTHAHVHACQQTLLEIPPFRRKLFYVMNECFYYSDRNEVA